MVIIQKEQNTPKSIQMILLAHSMILFLQCFSEVINNLPLSPSDASSRLAIASSNDCSWSYIDNHLPLFSNKGFYGTTSKPIPIIDYFRGGTTSRETSQLTVSSFFAFSISRIFGFDNTLSTCVENTKIMRNKQNHSTLRCLTLRDEFTSITILSVLGMSI